MTSLFKLFKSASEVWRKECSSWLGSVFFFPVVASLRPAGLNTDRGDCVQRWTVAAAFTILECRSLASRSAQHGRRRVNASRRPTGNGSRLNRTIPTTPPWSRSARRHTWERRVDWCRLPDRRRVANGNDAAAADRGRSFINRLTNRCSRFRAVYYRWSLAVKWSDTKF